jgi:UDP-3-O-[3-hydroxymyristoyl] glucosamine N-acyltransferase
MLFLKITLKLELILLSIVLQWVLLLLEKVVKLDNLIQIAHNVVIGENTVMAAQSGISGSVTIGRNCVFGGQSGAAGHITIGDKVT